MRIASLRHLSDAALDRELSAVVARDNASTACVLAHIAEFDARRLYLAKAHPSMFSYCVHVLHLSEQAAYKRIRAARAGRRFPAVLTAIAEGRLHLSATMLLAPHLRPGNVDQLLEAAMHRTRAQVEQMLASRFPKPDLPTRLQPFPSSGGAGQLSPGAVAALENVGSQGSARAADVLSLSEELSPGTVETGAGASPGAVRAAPGTSSTCWSGRSTR